MKRISVWSIAAIVLIATILKLAFNLLVDNGVAWDDPSFSENSAKLKGILVCSVDLAPPSVVWHGTAVSIQEAWVERQVHTSYPFIWGWRKNPSGKDCLCFTLKSGEQIFSGVDSPFFRSDSIQYGGGIGKIGNTKNGWRFFGELKPEALATGRADMRLVKTWNDSDSQSIRLSWSVPR